MSKKAPAAAMVMDLFEKIVEEIEKLKERKRGADTKTMAIKA